MKTNRKIIAVLFTVFIASFMAAIGLICYADSTASIKSVSNAGGVQNLIVVEFETSAVFPMVTNVADQKNYVYDYIKFDGKDFKAFESEMGADLRINQGTRGNNFDIWAFVKGTATAKNFPEGTTIQFKQGMGFLSDSSGTAMECVLDKDYSFEYTNGDWLNADSNEAEIVSLSPVITGEDSFSFTVQFNRTLSEEKAVAGSDLLEKLFVNGASLSETDLLSSVEVTLEGKILSVSVKKSGHVPNDCITFEVVAGTEFPSGVKTTEAFKRTFVNSVRWVREVYPTVVPDETKKIYLADTEDNFQPFEDGELVGIFIRFDAENAVSDETLNFYGSDIDWLYENAAGTGRTIESIDRAASDGTSDSLRENFMLDGKSISDPKFANGKRIMIHYNLSFLAVYFEKSSGWYDLDKSHTITLKSDLVFPSGYSMGRDLNLYYDPEIGGYTKINIESLDVGAQDVNIAVNEVYLINAVFEPKDATISKLRYTSTDEEVLKVNKQGYVTGLKEGDAQIYVETLDENRIVKTISFHCTDVDLEEIYLTKDSDALRIGSKIQLEVFFKPANASHKDIIFTSSDTAVATVSETGEVLTVGAGNAVIEISSKEFPQIKTSFTLDVLKMVTGLSIDVPDKTEYFTGEDFNYDGLVIRVQYDDGSEEILPRTKARITGFSNVTPGEQIVTVYYEGAYDSFLVTVKQRGEGETGCSSLLASNVRNICGIVAVVSAFSLLACKKKRVF